MSLSNFRLPHPVAVICLDRLKVADVAEFPRHAVFTEKQEITMFNCLQPPAIVNTIPICRVTGTLVSMIHLCRKQLLFSRIRHQTNQCDRCGVPARDVANRRNLSCFFS